MWVLADEAMATQFARDVPAVHGDSQGLISSAALGAQPHCK
jgi:hypothetical protein